MGRLIGCIAGFLLALNVYSDTTVISSSGAITTADVWDNGLPALINLGTIGIDGTWTVGTSLSGWDVTQTAGTVERTSSSNIQLDEDTVWRLFGGVIRQTGGGHIRVGSSVSSAGMTMSGGEVVATAGRFDVNYRSLLDISGGHVSAITLNFTGGGTNQISGAAQMSADEMIIGTGGGFLLDISGGAIEVTNALTVANQLNTVIRFNTGDGELSIGSVVFNGANGYFDFVTGSGGRLTIGGYDEEDYQALWDAGRLKADGQNDGIFASHFFVIGDTLIMGTFAETTFGTIQDAWNNGLPSATNPGHINIDGTWIVNGSTDMSGWVVVQATGTLTRALNAIVLTADEHWWLEGGAITVTDNSTSRAHFRVGDSVHSGELVMTGGSIYADGFFDVACNSLFMMTGGEVASVEGSRMSDGGRSYIEGGIGTFGGTLKLSSPETQMEFSGGSWVYSGGLTFAANTTTNTFIRFALGDGELFVGGIDVISGSGYIDFVTGSGGSFTVAGYGEANYQALWDAGKLKADGQNDGEFREHFIVDGNTLRIVAGPSVFNDQIVTSIVRGPPNSYFTYPHSHGFLTNGFEFVVAQASNLTTRFITVNPETGSEGVLAEVPRIKTYYSIADNGLMVYTSRAGDKAYVLDTTCSNSTPGLVAEVPNSSWYFSDLPSISPDGSQIVLDRHSKTNEDSEISIYDVSTGNETLLVQKPWVANHACFFPSDPSWVMFARGGLTPETAVAAQEEGRIWAWNATTAPNGVMLFEQQDSEGTPLITHHPIPYPNEEAILFVVNGYSEGSPRGLYKVTVDGSFNCISESQVDDHDNLSSDGILAVVDTGNHVAPDAPADTSSSEIRISDISLVNPANGNRMWIYRTTMESHPYHAHPHISPDKRWVIFNDYDEQRVVAVKLDQAALASFLAQP